MFLCCYFFVFRERGGTVVGHSRRPAPLVRDLSLSGDCHRDAYGLAFSVVERVLRRSVGGSVGCNPELASYPFRNAVLLDFNLDEPVIARLLLFAGLLGYARGVLRLAVG